MITRDELDRLYQLVATSPDQKDFVALINAIKEMAADVRNRAAGHDSVELRIAVVNTLQQIVDRIAKKLDTQSTTPEVDTD